ncbi:ABC transporter substrate-binding protein [Paracoccus albus]|uniref:ABC transporter substrate-binding protein n=1 Tax=Paracoccus albus TaxID=3017784 RepID=UPI0022F0DE0A|nr:extracellular solute-binding protein [Paracoccus albus]WBU62188.1 extracellular solute-binding protein [Paracoccus albus]
MNHLLGTSIFAVAIATAGAALAQTELSMWYHGAGNPEEAAVLNGIVEDFNASQEDWTVVVESFPQNSYNDSVVAAALSGNLPDILDVDGPNTPNWAWAGYLQPLPIDEAAVEKFLPGVLGYWNDELYSVGLWDAAVAMTTRQPTLDKYGIRTPTLEEPWTREEFDAALQTIKDSGDFNYPLDVGMADKGEWYPYAFGPFLWSFGGDMVDREGYQSAEGVLNGDEALEFGEWWQGLFENEMVPGTSQDMADHDNGFQNGEFAITWNGNWKALPYLEAYDDVVFLPAPDFGNGPIIGAASWQFAISSATEHPEGGAAFIEFAMQDEYLAEFSNAMGLIPPTPEAAAMSDYYSEGAPMEVFYGLSEAQGMKRPETPGYVVQALAFRKALTDIADGADVADALDSAVDEIDADIERNQGYGHQ